jgi:hypothetical protein
MPLDLTWRNYLYWLLYRLYDWLIRNWLLLFLRNNVYGPTGIMSLKKLRNIQKPAGFADVKPECVPLSKFGRAGIEFEEFPRGTWGNSPIDTGRFVLEWQ